MLAKAHPIIPPPDATLRPAMARTGRQLVGIMAPERNAQRSVRKAVEGDRATRCGRILVVLETSQTAASPGYSTRRIGAERGGRDKPSAS